MMLLTKANRAALPPLYSSEDTPAAEKMIHVKFFDPFSNWTWYAAEFDGQDLFFGFAAGTFPEWGYFSLAELKSIGCIERDRHFTPAPFSTNGQ